MKRLVVLWVTFLLLAGLLSPLAATAAEKAPAAASQPGVQMARTLSEITGVAISPLMGVSVVGAVKYMNTPQANRSKLPWFAQPWFWVPALIVVAICFIKDTAGTALPTAVKKPFDVIETVEHKVSGLVATGAFVPFAVSLMHDAGVGSSTFSAMGLAAIDGQWLYNLIMTPVAMVLFFVVFLASNAINILILLSPFTTVDTALKAFRTGVLATIVASAWANPWLGAMWAAIIVVISYFIAGWSFRLSHFGLVYVMEFLTMRHARYTPGPKVNKLFLSRKIDKAPARTYGKLSRDEQGKLVFDYHPWLILPKQTLVLPEGQYEVGHGLFYSEILRVEGDSTKTMILLPPRYRGHEQELVKIYSLAGMREVGFRAAWTWLKGIFGGNTAPQAV
ncbi:MAG: hypothetical protein U1F65_11930 [Verrucomicrobiota bacterium]